jgi:hypothetical protein
MTTSKVSGFLRRRALSYPARRIEEHREGLSLLGGLPHALQLAWTLLDGKLDEKPKLHFPRPRKGKRTLFPWAVALASCWGAEVRPDSLEELEAFLVRTPSHSVIYLRRHLPEDRQAWCICHELAHLALGHRSNTSYGLDPAWLLPEEILLFDRQEAAADALASLWLHIFEGLADQGHAPGTVDRAAPRLRQPTRTTAASRADELFVQLDFASRWSGLPW